MPNGPQSVRVLVISNAGDTYAYILRTRGYNAIAVYSAEEAIISGESRCPDAVIVEVCLERMGDGIRLATKVAEVFPTCKMILVSSNVEKASRFLTGYNFPLVKRPTYPADILPFVAAVDAIALGSCNPRESDRVM